jgi:hypothetical protein
LRELQIHF